MNQVRAGTATEAVSYDSPTLESVISNFNSSNPSDVALLEEVAGVANVATVGGVEVPLNPKPLTLKPEP